MSPKMATFATKRVHDFQKTIHDIYNLEYFFLNVRATSPWRWENETPFTFLGQVIL